jgi:hypothetical protein
MGDCDWNKILCWFEERKYVLAFCARPVSAGGPGRLKLIASTLGIACTTASRTASAGRRRRPMPWASRSWCWRPPATEIGDDAREPNRTSTNPSKTARLDAGKISRQIVRTGNVLERLGEEFIDRVAEKFGTGVR